MQCRAERAGFEPAMGVEPHTRLAYRYRCALLRSLTPRLQIRHFRARGRAALLRFAAVGCCHGTAIDHVEARGALLRAARHFELVAVDARGDRRVAVAEPCRQLDEVAPGRDRRTPALRARAASRSPKVCGAARRSRPQRPARGSRSGSLRVAADRERSTTASRLAGRRRTDRRHDWFLGSGGRSPEKW